MTQLHSQPLQLQAPPFLPSTAPTFDSMPTPPRDLEFPAVNPFGRETLGPRLSTGVNAILGAVASSGEFNEKRAFALSKAMKNRKLAPLVQSAGLLPSKEHQQFKMCISNAAKWIKRAREKEGPGGSINHDKKSMVETAFSLFVSTPVNSPSNPAQASMRCSGAVSVSTLSGAFGIPRSSAARLHKRAHQKHHELVDRKDGTSWSRCKPLNAKVIFTESYLRDLWEWVTNHHQVVQSPIVNDTLLIKNLDGEKVAVTKLLLRIPIYELHNDLIKPVEEGGFALGNDSGEVQMSDTSLRDHLPPQLC